MKHVIQAGLTQISYLDWDNIKKNTPINTAIFDKMKRPVAEELSVKSRILFQAYTEDYDYNEPLWIDEFEDWYYLHSCRDIDIFTDIFQYEPSTIDEIKNKKGFYAVTYINKKSKELCICFRGTNDLMDVVTDIDLAFLKKYNKQLAYTYWYIRNTFKTKEYAGYKVYFTGHSLGGALAQYAHLMYIGLFDKEATTYTFNALGAGNTFVNRYDGIFSVVNTVKDIYREISVMYDRSTIELVNKLAEDDYILNHTREAYEQVMANLCKAQKKYTDMCIKERTSPYNMEDIRKQTAKIVGAVKSVCLIAKGFRFCNKTEFNVINYIFPDDWTATLLDHIGTTIDVTTGNIVKNSSIPVLTNSRIGIAIKTFRRFGFAKHSVGNFLMFLCDDGNFCYGKIRDMLLEHFLIGVYKNILKKYDRYFDTIKKSTDMYDYSIKKCEIDKFLDMNYIMSLPEPVPFIHYELFKRNVLEIKDRKRIFDMADGKEAVIIGYDQYNNLQLDKNNDKLSILILIKE